MSYFTTKGIVNPLKYILEHNYCCTIDQWINFIFFADLAGAIWLHNADTWENGQDSTCYGELHFHKIYFNTKVMQHRMHLSNCIRQWFCGCSYIIDMEHCFYTPVHVFPIFFCFRRSTIGYGFQKKNWRLFQKLHRCFTMLVYCKNNVHSNNTYINPCMICCWM